MKSGSTKSTEKIVLKIFGGSGDEVGNRRRGGFRVGVGEEDLVGLVC